MHALNFARFCALQCGNLDYFRSSCVCEFFKNATSRLWVAVVQKSKQQGRVKKQGEEGIIDYAVLKGEPFR